MTQGYAIPSIDSLAHSKAFSWEGAKCDVCGGQAEIFDGAMSAYFCRGCY